VIEYPRITFALATGAAGVVISPTTALVIPSAYVHALVHTNTH
jgi:hypothetical protein